MIKIIRFTICFIFLVSLIVAESCLAITESEMMSFYNKKVGEILCSHNPPSQEQFVKVLEGQPTEVQLTGELEGEGMTRMGNTTTFNYGKNLKTYGYCIKSSYDGHALIINDEQYPPAQINQTNNLNIASSTIMAPITQANNSNDIPKSNNVTDVIKGVIILVIGTVVGGKILNNLNKKDD